MRSGAEETLNKPEPAGIVRRALAFASAYFRKRQKGLRT